MHDDGGVGGSGCGHWSCRGGSGIDRWRRGGGRSRGRVRRGRVRRGGGRRRGRRGGRRRGGGGGGDVVEVAGRSGPSRRLPSTPPSWPSARPTPPWCSGYRRSGTYRRPWPSGRTTDGTAVGADDGRPGGALRLWGPRASARSSCDEHHQPTRTDHAPAPSRQSGTGLLLRQQHLSSARSGRRALGKDSRCLIILKTSRLVTVAEVQGHRSLALSWRTRYSTRR